MTDDRDDDLERWFADQFGTDAEEDSPPQQADAPEATGPPPIDPDEPLSPTPPTAPEPPTPAPEPPTPAPEPPPLAPELPLPPPAPPVPSTLAPQQNAGFSWGLKPRGATEEPQGGEDSVSPSAVAESPGTDPVPPVDAALEGTGPSEVPIAVPTDAPTEALTTSASEPTSGLDSLFTPTADPPAGPGAGDAATTVLPTATAVDETPRTTRPSRLGKQQRTMLWIAGSLVAALVLVGLYFLGTRLAEALGPAPAAVATPTTSPVAEPEPIAPAAPGEHAWDVLFGGECVDPYDGPWAEQFTVVGCESAHAAQLVARSAFGPDDGELTPYPGVEALQAQINLLCTAPTVIDYPAAGAYDDIQFEASYAATEQEWAEGHRDYFCFVSRESGDPITGSLAVPPAA